MTVLTGYKVPAIRTTVLALPSPRPGPRLSTEENVPGGPKDKKTQIGMINIGKEGKHDSNGLRM